MRVFSIVFLSVAILAIVGCSQQTPEEIIIDSSQPQGAFVAMRSGNFVEQNGTGTSGMAALGEDEEGTQFLRFGDSFMTNTATGTVTVYLSTSEMYQPDPANGNPDLFLIGAVRSNGENFFKLDSSVDSKFTHVILWCGSANIPFGYAELN